jgi:hypothetical protein
VAKIYCSDLAMDLDRHDAPGASPPERGYIGLSFSGGGYRATAFSLGTMALLHDLGLLRQARVMSSVSGGSLALGAYLCAKAGASLNREEDFHFYDLFWSPLMKTLATEDLARAFVRLPLLVDGGKLILEAADETQRFFNTLLGEDARLSTNAITQMLRNRSLSPDYVFFNAANISSLDLFRFGIQRGGDAEDAEPVYVLNRYFLTACGGSQEANELYEHAKLVRLGDCVAASFAFPGGFEPLIFPDDYFRSDGSAGDDEAMAKARSHFSKSLICDLQPYVAFLDGGLYDNLGLASVEDIRRFLARRCEDLELPQQFHSEGQNHQSEQPIHYVIATDVDNIQPGVGFYDEPSLDQRPEKEQANLGSRRRAVLRGFVPYLLLILITVVALPLLGFVLGLLASRLGEAMGIRLLLAVVAVVAGLLLLTLVGWGVLRRLIDLLRAWLEPIDLRRMLGLSPEFERQSRAIDLWEAVQRLLRAVLRGPQRATNPAALGRAIRERRLGQLLPAFNGYLKRTRSLTYGYLQKSYEGAHERRSESQRCHLIRNMIFELQPGPDVDPAYAADLITLPVRDYRRRERVELTQPIMRKLRRAAYARDLLLALQDQRQDQSDPSMALALQLLEPTHDSARDTNLERSRRDLNLDRAAHLWRWLTETLEKESRTGLNHFPSAVHPDQRLRDLAGDVRMMLQKAEEKAEHEYPGVADRQLRERCTVDLCESQKSYSWIPLICEMATNLSTTLWVKGFRWYEPNLLKEQQIVRIGGWHVQKPEPIADAMPLLDLGITKQDAPAAMITALAGYLSTVFNLLEFYYATLGNSLLVRARLVHILCTRRDGEWSEESLRQLANLPFTLREAALRELRDRHRFPPPGDPLTGKLAMLEPWLSCRDGFPEH